MFTIQRDGLNGSRIDLIERSRRDFYLGGRFGYRAGVGRQKSELQRRSARALSLCIYKSGLGE